MLGPSISLSFTENKGLLLEIKIPKVVWYGNADKLNLSILVIKLKGIS